MVALEGAVSLMWTDKFVKVLIEWDEFLSNSTTVLAAPPLHHLIVLAEQSGPIVVCLVGFQPFQM